VGARINVDKNVDIMDAFRQKQAKEKDDAMQHHSMIMTRRNQVAAPVYGYNLIRTVAKATCDLPLVLETPSIEEVSFFCSCLKRF